MSGIRAIAHEEHAKGRRCRVNFDSRSWQKTQSDHDQED